MGIIYFIQCLETNEIYIGSTTRTLEDRINGHRKQGNMCSSKQIIDRDNYIYDVLEEVDNNNLLDREQYYMETTDCINKKRAIVDKKEYMKQYYLDNIEKKKEYQSQNYTKTRDIRLEYIKKKVTCECGAIVCQGAITRHRKTKKHLLGIHNREQSIL